MLSAARFSAFAARSCSAPSFARSFVTATHAGQACPYTNGLNAGQSLDLNSEVVLSVFHVARVPRKKTKVTPRAGYSQTSYAALPLEKYPPRYPSHPTSRRSSPIIVDVRSGGPHTSMNACCRTPLTSSPCLTVSRSRCAAQARRASAQASARTIPLTFATEICVIHGPFQRCNCSIYSTPNVLRSPARETATRFARQSGARG